MYLNTYSPEFLKAIGLDPEKLKQEQQTQGLLGAGLALLAGSGPSSQPTSLGQLVGQAGQVGLQAMRGAGEDQIKSRLMQFDFAQKMAQAQQPKYMTLKDESGAERIVSIDKSGNITYPSLGGSQQQAGLYKFADQAFNQASQILYPGLRASDIQADPKKMAAVERKALEIKSEPGVAAERVKLRDPLRTFQSGFELVSKEQKRLEPDQDAVNRYGTLSANVANSTPIGDTAIVYSFAKILNPGEAIMEGDIRNILSNRSVPDSLKQAAEKAISGRNLTDQERIEFQSTAYRILKERQSTTERSLNLVKNQIKRIGDDPSQVDAINPYSALQKPPVLVVTVGGKKMNAKLAQDGNYYVQSGDKYYKVD